MFTSNIERSPPPTSGSRTIGRVIVWGLFSLTYLWTDTWWAAMADDVHGLDT